MKKVLEESDIRPNLQQAKLGCIHLIWKGKDGLASFGDSLTLTRDLRGIKQCSCGSTSFQVGGMLVEVGT